MRKYLLASVLIGGTMPAYAGPIMDKLMDGTPYVAVSAEIEDGAEVYEGFQVTPHGGAVHFDRIKLTENGELVNIEASGLRVSEDGVEVATVKTIMSSFPLALKEWISSLNGSAFDAASSRMFTHADCGLIDRQLNFDAQGISMDAPEVGQIMIDGVKSSYDIEGPAEDCILNFTSEVSGYVQNNDGLTVSAASMNMDMYGSLLTDVAPKNLDAVYMGDFGVEGLNVAVGGVDQLTIDEIRMKSESDAIVTAAMINAGYFQQLNALAQNGHMSGDAVTSQDIAKIWNGLLVGDSSADFIIDNAVIKGQMPQAMSGIEALAMGRTFNFGMSIDKKDDHLETSMDIASSDLVDFGLMLSLVMTPLDTGMQGVNPTAMLMSAPIAVSAAGIEFVDDGIGDLVKTMAGVDIYTDVPAMASGMIGPQKAEMIGAWLADAKTAGSYITVAPETPLPVMQAFVGFMGDWGAFGKMLKVTSSSN